MSYFSQTIRRIAALLLLGPQLDEDYERVKASTCTWPTAHAIETATALNAD